MCKCLVLEYIIDKCVLFDNVFRVGLFGLGKLKLYIIGLYFVEKVFIYYISNSKFVLMWYGGGFIFKKKNIFFFRVSKYYL